MSGAFGHWISLSVRKRYWTKDIRHDAYMYMILPSLFRYIPKHSISMIRRTRTPHGVFALEGSLPLARMAVVRVFFFVEMCLVRGYCMLLRNMWNTNYCFVSTYSNPSISLLYDFWIPHPKAWAEFEYEVGSGLWSLAGVLFWKIPFFEKLFAVWVSQTVSNG